MSFLKRWLHRRVAATVDWLQGVEQFAKWKRLLENGTVVVGRHTYGRPRIWEYCGSERKVVIGSFCSISPEVEIITGGIHPTDWVSTFPFRIAWRMPGAFADGMPSSRGDTVIGSDVWIGTGAMILSGVTIGHGSVVAARSLVARDVPPYAIVAGAPARVVRSRFSPERRRQASGACLVAMGRQEDSGVRTAPVERRCGPVRGRSLAQLPFDRLRRQTQLSQ